jgi:hypothetical protein
VQYRVIGCTKAKGSQTNGKQFRQRFRHRGNKLSAAVASAEVLSELARQEITVRNPVDVSAYLESHADLADLIPLVSTRARGEFGGDAELTMRVNRDPEADGEILALYVRFPSYGEDSMERIEKFSRQFDDALSEVSGYFLISTDFWPARANNVV